MDSQCADYMSRVTAWQELKIDILVEPGGACHLCNSVGGSTMFVSDNKPESQVHV